MSSQTPSATIISRHLEKGQPWQNLMEAQFKVQLRLADFKFEQAQGLEAIQSAHTDFIDTFNTTRHYAHRKRADGYRTPVDVLGWLRGRRVEAKELRERFSAPSFCTRSIPMAVSACNASISMPKVACRGSGS